MKEVTYHRDHATDWTLRLGDGTAESHRRIQDSFDALWRFVAELFETDDRSTGWWPPASLPTLSRLQREWARDIDAVLAAATLDRPATTALPGTGRSGRHSEHLGYMLAEMQHLHRLHPGATW